MTMTIGAVFLAVSLLSFVTLSIIFAEDRQVARRLTGLTAYEVGQAKDAQPLLKPFRQRVGAPLTRSIGRMAASFGPKGYRQRVAQNLTLAGDPMQLSADALIAIKVGCSLLLTSVVVALVAGEVLDARWLLVAAPGALVLGYLAPNVWVDGRIDRRQTRIRTDLPDMLDMLTISVEAGLGFDAALSKYVKNSTGVLAVEFGQVLQEMQGGVPRREGLRRLQTRTGVAELNSFISAMIQADTLGTSISAVLRTQSRELRLRRRQKAEEEAQKLPVKMVFPVVLCILPATMIVVLGPSVIFLMDFFKG